MKKTFFLPILSFLIFAFVLYGLVPPLSELRLLKENNKKQTMALEQAKDYFVRLAAISDELEQNQEILTNIERALPEEVSVPSLMNFFQITAAESGLLLHNFGYDDAAGQGNIAGQAQTPAMPMETDSEVKSVVFDLSLEGNLASFLAFMKNLEVSSRLLEVGSMSFQVGGDAGDAKEQFNVAVKAYSY
ncbi:MAG: type 4a pilus biogenesis protein PilO [Candidatus Pacebacteria bacterium]|nr:type 4a pilus biogenesis protein PilO [Candidatus Paceibacterota bacterium]